MRYFARMLDKMRLHANGELSEISDRSDLQTIGEVIDFEEGRRK